MKKRLTLNIDAKLFDDVEVFAKDRNTSISEMVINYLNSINQSNDVNEITPLVQSLSGIINLNQDYNFKRDYTAYLNKKYS